jgi:hypothetical protein
MTRADFSTTLWVDQSPEEVFDAINNPRAWWSGEIEGHTNKLNDEFTYRYKDLHMSKQRIVEMIPGKKVEWLVTDSHINYARDKSEWTGTKMSFEIAEKGNKTQLRFTHHGLVPEIECFDTCSGSWTQLIREGLFNLINTGTAKKIVLG